ncbi:hypothetical protein R50072_05710 [Simiduia litorea]|uniref:type IV pilus modification protein PilV n=1 Tax=Simiduia litorea TaxID=1435348 RepID=UPI0036F432DF
MIVMKKEAGATMIELMVALFILAVGLLGALALQMNSVRSSQSAVFTSDAQVVAVNMADRIMAYNSVLTTDEDDDYAGINTTALPADPNCKVAGCSAANRVASDVNEWGRELASRLPGGQGTITYAANVYTILVMWDRDNTGANATGCGGNPEVDLTCYQLEFRL